MGTVIFTDGSPVSISSPSEQAGGVGVVTLHDVIEQLVEGRFGLASDKEYAVVKRAARASYRDLIVRGFWRYMLREWQIAMNAPYDTGTIVYDHADGASERLVTLSDGTWPDWAQYGRLKIGNSVYVVERRISGTALTLHNVLNPGDDIASTGDWVLYRNTYPLPDGFVRIQDMHQENYWMHCYIEPDKWMEVERERNYSGKPFHWTVMHDDERDGAFAVRTMGYPDQAENLYFFYQHRGREPVLSGFETATTAGTLTLNSGSTSVTGSGTSFDSRMVGSYLRVGDSGTEVPTSQDGLTPFLEEHKIKSVESATALTLYTEPSQTLSAKKFHISDYFDLEPGMINALYRGAEWQLSLIMRDLKSAEKQEEVYLRSVRLATEADYRAHLRHESGSKMGFYPSGAPIFDSNPAD